MRIIDPHIHMYTRTTDDYEQMALAGIESGFDRITEAEEEVLRKQLRMAMERRMPVILHTPHQYKRVGVERIIRILHDEDVDQDLILVDHNTEETMPLFAGLRVWRALTVYPVTKLSPERAANIVRQYGVERLLVNSSADWGPSDVLSVPRVANLLLRLGFPREEVERLVFWNPLQFFAQSPGFTLPDGVTRAKLG